MTIYKPASQQWQLAISEGPALLVEMAGTEPVHIEMLARGPKKYYDVARALSLKDACAHLAGKKTKGAVLRSADGLTRALCHDANTDDDWYILREAAHFLASAGYIPLMEDSPAGRGGHLWIESVFTEGSTFCFTIPRHSAAEMCKTSAHEESTS